MLKIKDIVFRRKEMKVFVDENEDYRITYSSHDGSECLESMGMQPIVVESLSDYTKQVRKNLIKELKNHFDNNFYFDISGAMCISMKEFDEFLDQIQGE